MPDLDTTVFDGDPNHAGLHQDSNIEVNSLRARMATAESDIATVRTTAENKFTLPPGGLVLGNFNLLAIKPVIVRRYVNGAWEVRGTTSTDVTVLWIKSDPAQPNPPIDATYFLLDIDVLLAASV